MKTQTKIAVQFSTILFTLLSVTNLKFTNLIITSMYYGYSRLELETTEYAKQLVIDGGATFIYV